MRSFMNSATQVYRQVIESLVVMLKIVERFVLRLSWCWEFSSAQHDVLRKNYVYDWLTWGFRRWFWEEMDELIEFAEYAVKRLSMNKGFGIAASEVDTNDWLGSFSVRRQWSGLRERIYSGVCWIC